MNKRFVSMVLAGLCLATLAACGEKEEKPNNVDNKTDIVEQEHEQQEEKRDVKGDWETWAISLEDAMASGEVTIDELLEIRPDSTREAIELGYIDGLDAMEKGYITEEEAYEHNLVPQVVHCKFGGYTDLPDDKEWESDVDLRETEGQIPDISFLSEIYIGKYVNKIDPDTLEDAHLRKIEVDEENPYFVSVDNAIYNKDQTTLIRVIHDFQEKRLDDPEFVESEFTVAPTVTKIGDKAFANSWIRNVNLPNGLTNIGDEAFSGCRLLNNLDLPDTVTDIGYLAFYGCQSIKTLKLPEGLETVREDTFTNMSNDSIEFMGSRFDPFFRGSRNDRLRNRFKMEGVKVRM